MSETAASASNAQQFSEEYAIALVQRAEAAAGWMEAVAQELELMISHPQNTLGQTAESFVLARNVNEILEDARKKIGSMVNSISYSVLPERLQAEDLTNFKTASGYRVQLSTRVAASILDKPKAFAWLREKGLGDIIQESVNSQTLSAQVKQLIEDENIEPPADIIKVNTTIGTSVVKAGKR